MRRTPMPSMRLCRLPWMRAHLSTRQSGGWTLRMKRRYWCGMVRKTINPLLSPTRGKGFFPNSRKVYHGGQGQIRIGEGGMVRNLRTYLSRSYAKSLSKNSSQSYPMLPHHHLMQNFSKFPQSPICFHNILQSYTIMNP